MSIPQIPVLLIEQRGEPLASFAMLGVAAGIEVVARYQGHRPIEGEPERRPTVIVADIGDVSSKSIRNCLSITQKYPEAKLLVLTDCGPEDNVLAALMTGADGYCVRDVKAEQLFLAIQAVASGGVWLDATIAEHIMKQEQPVAGGRPAAGQMNRYGLSTTELNVLRLLVAGATNRGIAQYMGLSPQTVKTHVRNIFRKLMVDDRTAAAVKAIREHL